MQKDRTLDQKVSKNGKMLWQRCGSSARDRKKRGGAGAQFYFGVIGEYNPPEDEEYGS